MIRCQENNQFNNRVAVNDDYYFEGHKTCIFIEKLMVKCCKNRSNGTSLFYLEEVINYEPG